jgi:hypothetical protein
MQNNPAELHKFLLKIDPMLPAYLYDFLVREAFLTPRQLRTLLPLSVLAASVPDCLPVHLATALGRAIAQLPDTDWWP